jgi:hypothetical protein
MAGSNDVAKAGNFGAHSPIARHMPIKQDIEREHYTEGFRRVEYLVPPILLRPNVRDGQPRCFGPARQIHLLPIIHATPEVMNLLQRANCSVRLRTDSALKSQGGRFGPRP